VIVAAAGDLLAIRAADGAVLWRRSVGPVEFRPSLDGELLVVAIADGRVLALELSTGEPLWERQLGATPGEPLVIGCRVYVGTKDKFFYILHASSGRRDARLRIGAAPTGRAAIDDRHVYFAAMDNVLTAIDRGHGARKWNKGLTYRPVAGPVIVGGFVTVPGYVASLPAFSSATGSQAGQVAFASRLAALPVFVDPPDGVPTVLAIIGDLENNWALTMIQASMVPAIPISPLTDLPGEAVPLPFAIVGPP
jgi:outer membrane protein assembly factor BamB